MVVSMTEGYPFSAGHRGIDTSSAAAEVINETLPRLQRTVLSVVAAAGVHGATADEIADVLAWERHRVRPRTSELRRAGKISDGGGRRSGKCGIAQIVWVLPKYAEREVGNA
jgi:hypothetical protein